MTHPFAPSSLCPTPEQIERHLRRTMEVAERAVSMGRHPFGAVLVAPDNETVPMEQCNIDTVNHAESTLARTAASSYPADYPWSCTLYNQLAAGGVALQQVWGRPALPAAFTVRAARPTEAPPPAPAPLKPWSWPKI